MTDGLDDYFGHELEWAVGTIIENAIGVGLSNFSSTQEMLDATYEFICANYEMVELEPPTEQVLLLELESRIKDDEDFDFLWS